MKVTDLDDNKPYTYVIKNPDGTTFSNVDLGGIIKKRYSEQETEFVSAANQQIVEIKSGIGVVPNANELTALLRGENISIRPIVSELMEKIAKGLTVSNNWRIGDLGRMRFSVVVEKDIHKDLIPLITQSLYERLQDRDYVGVSVTVTEGDSRDDVNEIYTIKFVCAFGIPARKT